MRTEANLNQWKELYEVVARIKELDPWNYLCDMDIITILPSKEAEPYYCSIMGNAGQYFAIGVYDGVESINDFCRIADNEDIPNEQLIRYQNNIMTCHFGDREDLTKQEYNIIKGLGLKFRGRNNWIYFRSIIRGYAPYILDEDEVLKMTEILKHLFMALKALNSGVEVDFQSGNTLLRRYDDESKLWLNHEAPALITETQYLTPVLQDELLVSRLKNQKRVNENLELDIAYLNTAINDRAYERPIRPRICLLADSKTGMLISNSMLGPEDEDVNAIFDAFIHYVMEFGKPRSITVRDEYIESLLSDICERVGVELIIEGDLSVVDEFTRGLVMQLFK